HAASSGFPVRRARVELLVRSDVVVFALFGALGHLFLRVRVLDPAADSSVRSPAWLARGQLGTGEGRHAGSGCSRSAEAGNAKARETFGAATPGRRVLYSASRAPLAPPPGRRRMRDVTEGRGGGEPGGGGT